MLLDTFTILFEADSKKLKEGLEDSRKEADKLNDHLKQADDNAQKTTTSLGSAFKAVAALAAGFLAAGAAQATFTETIAELATIGRTAESLGLAVEDVDAFGRSMVAMGGDAQGARDSLVDMAESIGEAIQDTESGRAKVYAGMKIHLKDVNGQAITATEGMLRLAEAVQGMSKEEAIFRIKELGITDNRTVELILKGRKEMERMLAVQKEQSGVTKEAVENATKYNAAIGRLTNAQDSIATQITSALLPAFTTVVEALAKGTEWVRNNSQAVIAFFAGIAGVVAIMYLPAMISAAAATLAVTWPLVLAATLVTALAATFALLYDDIENFLAGNDSLIGQISEKYPIVGQIVTSVAEGISAAWQGLQGVMQSLWDALSPLGTALGDTFGAAGQAASAFMNLISAVVARVSSLLGVDLAGAFTTVGDTISFVMNAAMAVVRGAVSFIVGALGQITETVSGIGAAIRGVAGFIGMKKEGDSVDGAMRSGGKTISSANAAPLNSTTSNAIANTANSVNRETNVQVGQVTVQTQATDAQGIAGDVGGALSSQLARLDNEFASGVDR